MEREREPEEGGGAILLCISHCRERKTRGGLVVLAAHSCCGAVHAVDGAVDEKERGRELERD